MGSAGTCETCFFIGNFVLWGLKIMQVHSIISFYILKWIMLANMINIIMIQGMAIAWLSGWVKKELKSWSCASQPCPPTSSTNTPMNSGACYNGASHILEFPGILKPWYHMKYHWVFLGMPLQNCIRAGYDILTNDASEHYWYEVQLVFL